MSEEIQFSKQELLQHMQAGWERLQAFVAEYSDEQLTGPTDAAGWTAKDHLMHLSVWAGSMVAVLNSQPRRDYMEISREDWVTLAETYDVVNGILQQRYKDLPLAEVHKAVEEKHNELVARVEAMTEEELQLPYNHYQPNSKSTTPIFEYISGNSFGHYDEHIPWMRTLIQQ
ncbi:MAG: ClbS/DfsB family four-helix bundle protein [Anaerolineales bacterium]|nr:ClbS/DfsB family four-helix bundle protein [Anaerolineales bacterium]QYK50419.1 MAG: ClbS/DfsB family four-helix bundle protein [Anaerolineales bacterium]